MADMPRMLVDLRNEPGDAIIWYGGRQQLVRLDIYRRCSCLENRDGSGVAADGFGEPVSAALVVDDTLQESTLPHCHMLFTQRRPWVVQRCFRSQAHGLPLWIRKQA